MRAVASILCCLIGVAASQPAPAADLGARKPAFVPRIEPVAPLSWYVHAGLGGIILSESARMTAVGNPVPGASIAIDPQLTPVVEVGYFLTPNIAVSLTGGLPPKINVHAKGSIAGLGVLASAVYGPSTLTAHYHFTEFGAFQPYVGAGIAYMKVFSTKDRALANTKMDDTFGLALQAGVDIMINRNWGMFFDLKKAFLKTDASGILGGVPIRAKVTLDPVVVHSGVTYRF
jgi:outer membrane protein